MIFCVQTVSRSLLGVFRESVVKRLKLSGQVVIPLRFVVFRKEFCLFREKNLYLRFDCREMRTGFCISPKSPGG